MRWMRALPLCLLFLSACSDDGSDDPIGPGDEERSPVTFGIRHDRELDAYEAVGANLSPYDSAVYPDFGAVVAFSYSLDGSDEQDYVASGTLVRPDWILTAGHNFYTEEQSAPAPVAGISLLVGADPNAPRSEHAVAELVFHPLWGDGFETAFDLCLVRLATPVSGIEPAQINFDAAESVGSALWVAGYGDYSQQPGEDPEAFSARHALENVLDRIVSDSATDSLGSLWRGGRLAFDFDSPLGDGNTLGDDVVSLEEEELGAGDSDEVQRTFEGTTVAGDSGGPLYLRIGGSWRVAGVLSEGIPEPLPGHEDGSYGDISVFVRTSAHRDWILSVLP